MRACCGVDVDLHVCFATHAGPADAPPQQARSQPAGRQTDVVISFTWGYAFAVHAAFVVSLRQVRAPPSSTDLHRAPSISSLISTELHRAPLISNRSPTI